MYVGNQKHLPPVHICAAGPGTKKPRVSSGFKLHLEMIIMVAAVAASAVLLLLPLSPGIIYGGFDTAAQHSSSSKTKNELTQ